MTIGIEIRAHMRAQGHTTPSLSAETGISEATIDRYLRGVIDISASKAARIVLALGMKPKRTLELMARGGPRADRAPAPAEGEAA